MHFCISSIFNFISFIVYVLLIIIILREYAGLINQLFTQKTEQHSIHNVALS